MRIVRFIVAMLTIGSAIAQRDKHPLDPAPLGIAWGFLYGTSGVPAEKFVPKIKSLGGEFSKIYLLWQQVEPQKGKYDWAAVDAYVKQLDSRHQGLISIFSSSLWATRRPSAMLPPSPAKQMRDYYRFVYDLVSHCKGKVQYWQNDSEPSNPIYWSGTKEEFVDEVKVFYRAVKDADPAATVVLGGFDGLFNPAGLPPMFGQQTGLTFFDYVLKEGRNSFDVFDLRLYANPYTIQGRVETIRAKMRALGYDKPILCTEYGGPGLFEFLVNRKYISLATAWSQVMQKQGTSGELTKNPVAELYSMFDTLAPQTQIFMKGCSADLQAKFDRIAGRDIVMRNLFAFASGVQRTLYWDLWNDSSKRDDLMTLMYGKIMMIDYENGVLTKVYPIAKVFRRMAIELKGIKQVTQIPIDGRPTIFFFHIDRGRRAPLYVAWEKRDTFSGEDEKPTEFDLIWKYKAAHVSDVFGEFVKAEVVSQTLHIKLGNTPVYIER